jgi:hypothetical protein
VEAPERVQNVTDHRRIEVGANALEEGCVVRHGRLIVFH